MTLKTDIQNDYLLFDGVETVTLSRQHPDAADVTGVQALRRQLTIGQQAYLSGAGIDTDGTVFHLFESTKGARGTGLGLAVSQKILREHGGDISVESAPGQGTQFRLAWPLLNEERLRADSAEYDALPQ